MNITSEFTVDPPRLLVKGIDGKAAAGSVLTLGTVPAFNGRVLGLIDMRVGLLAGSGITTSPVFSVGITGPNYTDLVTSKSLAGATQGNMGIVALNAQYPWVSAGTAIVARMITQGVAPGPISLALLLSGFWL